jgi:hypothetical protein
LKVMIRVKMNEIKFKDFWYDLEFLLLKMKE